MSAKIFKYAKLHLHTVLLISTITAYLFICLVPFILFGPTPLGYDTGFYRRFLVNPGVSFPNPPVPGLDHTVITPRIFLDIIRFLGLSPNITLYGSYILLFLIFALVFYFFIKEYTNKKTALIALVLLVLSPVQYIGYWFMLYKNFFGLIFFLLTFIFLKRNWFWPALVCALIIPLSHQTTTIIFLGILAGYILLTLVFKKKFLISELVILALTLFTYLYFHPHVQEKIDAPPVAVFIEKLDFFLLALPLILLTLAGLPKFIKILKQNLPLAALGAISVLFPLLSLPYYQRIFLFTNYWLILGAAVGLESLITTNHEKKNQRHVSIMFITAVLFLQIGLLVYQIHKYAPLLDRATAAEVQQLQNEVPTNASVLTSVRLTPWVQGWTTAKVYAPGILKDQHTSSDWREYWAGSDNEKISFLSSFPKPLYIFINSSESNLFIPKISCVQKLSQMLYVDQCPDTPNGH